MKSRRDFLKLGGFALASGLLISSSPSVFGQRMKKGDYFRIPDEVYGSRIFNSNDFEPYLNGAFQVSGDKNAKAKSLRLIEVVKNEAQKKALNKRSADGFNLIFELEGKGKLADEIYNFSHPELGNFQLFISTVGRSGRRFQAVFSRVYY